MCSCVLLVCVFDCCTAVSCFVGLLLCIGVCVCVLIMCVSLWLTFRSFGCFFVCADVLRVGVCMFVLNVFVFSRPFVMCYDIC